MKRSTLFSIRVDEKIIFTMIAVSLLALSFTAFRYKNTKPCEAFEFTMRSNSSEVGTTIFFETKANNVNTWEWDFGDKSKLDTKSGPLATHIYKEAGQYLVTLKINDECVQNHQIIISEISNHSTGPLEPNVSWPVGAVSQGQIFNFVDNTNNGANSTTTWYFEDESKQTRKYVGKSLPYTFSTVGQLKINVEVDGDNHYSTAKIIIVGEFVNTNPISKAYMPQNASTDRSSGFEGTGIKNNPGVENILNNKNSNNEPPPDKMPEAELLTNDILQGLVIDIIENRRSIDCFEKYLVGNTNLTVILNSESLKLADCVDKLKKLKLKQLKSISSFAVCSPENHKLLSINIGYKKKTIYRIL
jgi:PKD repeat protein